MIPRKRSADGKTASRIIPVRKLASVLPIKQEAIKDDAQIQKILIAQLMGMGRSFMR